MSPPIIGLIGVGVMLFFMAMGMPIAFTMGAVGFAGIVYLGGMHSALSVLSIYPFEWGSQQVLLTIPLFVLMGFFAMHSGLSRDLYQAGFKWLGRLPGGLAIATTFGCAGFSAVSGSSVGTAAAMGTVSIPEMLKYGYSKTLAAGTAAAGGTLGVLIPPSTTFIIYGVLTEESIGKLFLAGIVPGILVALFYSTMIFTRVKINPSIAPPAPGFSWKERLGSLKGIGGILILFLLVIGGIWGGVFTPTEAAAVGAFGAFLFVVARRQLHWKSVIGALTDTMRIACMVMAIIIGAMIFNYFITISQLPMNLSEWIAGLHASRYWIIALVLLIYIPLGMFMDALAMIVLTLPIFYPLVVKHLGFSGIWFGVLIVRMAEIAAITPPVGINCYTVAGISKSHNIPLSEVFKGIFWFVFSDFANVALLVAFPILSLWLPGTMK